MRLTIEVSNKLFEKLWDQAARSYLRENPRAAWTRAEKIKAVRWFVQEKLL
jgi:hypothetical protein